MGQIHEPMKKPRRKKSANVRFSTVIRFPAMRVSRVGSFVSMPHRGEGPFFPDFGRRWPAADGRVRPGGLIRGRKGGKLTGVFFQ